MVARTSFTDDEVQAIAGQPVARYLLGLLPGMAGIVCLALKWPSDHIAVMAVITLVTAYSMLCYTSCLHETIHQTLFRRPRWNVTLGRIIGTVIFVPYTAYRETHIRHHAYLNTPDDWELWPYVSPHASLWFRRVFVWVDLLFGFFASAVIYGRIFFHPRSPLPSREIRRSIWYEYGLSVTFWAILLTLLVRFDVVGDFVRAWLVPALIAGVLQSGRKLTEHLGMSSYDPLLGTRTVIGQNWFTQLCSLMNFDIFVHGPHHRYPRLPHTMLTTKMREHADGNRDTQFPVFPSYRRAIMAMVRHLFVNPGSGMNAGGDVPPRHRASDADFVSDVLTS
jgi:fatty acid desaturase